ncbi:MAG: cupin domain-containing protein [Actinomycetota bacterium]|nr:cupin domain-containing protein [Actinomycetota bacterium]
MANVFDPEWDGEQDKGPFQWRRARIGGQAGARDLGASLYEIPPGGSTFPLHFHHANEEMAIVLVGRPTLRTLDGERELSPGEAVAFQPGRDGAHRLDNRTDEPVRVVILSTMRAPEIVDYPESRKIGLASIQTGLRKILPADRELDYFDGEL